VRLGEERQLEGNYLYSGSGTPASPKIGDIRISYSALASGEQVTAFGVQRGETLTPYLYRGETRFYRALIGDRATAIATLRSEYVMLGWALRFGGFLMMWFGMLLCFQPINTFLSIIPAVSQASGCLFGGITAGIALVLTTITVLIAVIAHNVFLLAIVLALLIGGVLFWNRMATAKRQAV
jgi:Transmembrane protein 43